jgi:hypothetical protein
MISAD